MGWPMRSVLIDWLVQVHEHFGLLPETLYLCVNIIDRFLSVRSVNPGKLQLIGMAALFIAAKYEEKKRSVPSVNSMIYMAANSYSAEEFLKAERYVLDELRFEFGRASPMSWLRRYSHVDRLDLPARTLAMYLIELTLLDERFLGWSASQVAAAGYCLSRILLRKGDWVSCK